MIDLCVKGVYNMSSGDSEDVDWWSNINAGDYISSTWGNIGKYKDTNLTSDLSVTLKDIVPGNSNLSLEFSYGNLKEFSGTYPEELWDQYKVYILTCVDPRYRPCPGVAATNDWLDSCNVATYPEYGSPDIQRAVTQSGNYRAVSVKLYINELNDVRQYIKLGVVNTDATPTYRDGYNRDECYSTPYQLSPNKKISRNGLLISSGFDYDKFNIGFLFPFSFKKEKWEQESPTYNSIHQFSDKTSYLRLSIGYCFMF